MFLLCFCSFIMFYLGIFLYLSCLWFVAPIKSVTYIFLSQFEYLKYFSLKNVVSSSFSSFSLSRTHMIELCPLCHMGFVTFDIFILFSLTASVFKPTFYLLISFQLCLFKPSIKLCISYYISYLRIFIVSNLIHNVWWIIIPLKILTLLFKVSNIIVYGFLWRLCLLFLWILFSLSWPFHISNFFYWVLAIL